VQDGRVGGVDPVEKHHVRDLGVEGEHEAAEVAREADHRLPNLVRKDACGVFSNGNFYNIL
jgi:hypothetical protein